MPATATLALDPLDATSPLSGLGTFGVFLVLFAAVARTGDGQSKLFP
jgi:hypothetical protein